MSIRTAGESAVRTQRLGKAQGFAHRPHRQKRPPMRPQRTLLAEGSTCRGSRVGACFAPGAQSANQSTSRRGGHNVMPEPCESWGSHFHAKGD